MSLDDLQEEIRAMKAQLEEVQKECQGLRRENNERQNAASPDNAAEPKPDDLDGQRSRKDFAGAGTVTMAAFHDDDETHEHEESTWDAALFIGIMMPWTQTVFAVFIFAVNLLCQLLFMELVAEFSNDPDPMVTEEGREGLLQWRLSRGHDINNYDEITKTNLVTRVCGSYFGLTTSTPHAEGHAAFEQYLQEGFIAMEGLPEVHSWLNMSLGEFLCLLVLIAWVTTIMVEYLSIWNQLMAVMSLPRSALSRMLRDEDDNLVLESISVFRFGFFLVVVLIPRIFVTSVLLAIGSRWLIHTASLGDLILNAVALAFIFDLDELFFNLMPRTCKRLVRETQPLPMTSTLASFFPSWVQNFKKKYGHYGCREMGFAALVTMTVCIYYFGSLQDVVDNINEGNKIICSGNIDFVYATDRATGIIHYGLTGRGEDELTPEVLLTSTGKNQATVLSLESSAVLQLTGLRDLNLEVVDSLAPVVTGDRNARMSVEESVEVVGEINRNSKDEAMARLPCEDLDRSPAERYVLYTEVALPQEGPFESSPGMTTCSSLAAHCGLSGMKTRCPETCNCTAVLTGSYNLEACPPSCQEKVEIDLSARLDKVVEVNSADCVDAPVKPDPVTNPGVHVDWWRTYFWELQQSLAEHGYLEKVDDQTAWPWTTRLQETISSRTQDRYFLHDGAKFDLLAMARFGSSNAESHGNSTSWPLSPCLLESLLRFVFNLNLCRTEFNGDFLGTLTALCPVQCSHCSIIPQAGESVPFGMVARDWSWLDLANHQEEYYGVTIIGQRAPTPVQLECGTTFTINTHGSWDYGFLQGPDAMFLMDLQNESLFYTLDLCGPRTQIDTVMRVMRAPWRQGMDLIPEMVLEASDNECGAGGLASSLSLSGLAAGKYLIWVDGEQVEGGQIEVTYRCTEQPLYWELLDGPCEISVAPRPNQSCARVPEMQGNCSIRVFPDAWKRHNMVLYPEAWLGEAGEFRVKTELGDRVNAMEFPALGERPIQNIEWEITGEVDRSPGNPYDTVYYGHKSRTRGPLHWEVCTKPREDQPWILEEGISICERYMFWDMDCIRRTTYGPNEYCYFRVPIDWSQFEVTQRGMYGFLLDTSYDWSDEFSLQGGDRLWVDFGTDSAQWFMGNPEFNDQTGLMSYIHPRSNIVWSSDRLKNYLGFEVCVHRTSDTGW